MAEDINRVTITGNLTADPDLRNVGSGVAICKMRVANNVRRKVSGEWTDKVNYFDVDVWGAQGETCAARLSKGSQVAIDGRLEWREWGEEGSKRQAVSITADQVKFLGRRDDNPGTASGGGFTPRTDMPADDDFQPAAAGAATRPPADDDIPF